MCASVWLKGRLFECIHKQYLKIQERQCDTYITKYKYVSTVLACLYFRKMSKMLPMKKNLRWYELMTLTLFVYDARNSSIAFKCSSTDCAGPCMSAACPLLSFLYSSNNLSISPISVPTSLHCISALNVNSSLSSLRCFTSTAFVFSSSRFLFLSLRVQTEKW